MIQKIPTVAYPRSGNTFLDYALRLMYYPEDKLIMFYHTEKSVDKFNKFLVPLRNPLDAIASWSIYSDLYKGSTEDHINFYIRLNAKILNNKHKSVILDFEKFTQDLSYLENVIKNNFGYSVKSKTSIEDIKSLIKEELGDNWTPRNNKIELNKTKEIIESNQLYTKAFNFYNNLKEATALLDT